MSQGIKTEIERTVEDMSFQNWRIKYEGIDRYKIKKGEWLYHEIYSEKNNISFHYIFDINDHYSTCEKHINDLSRVGNPQKGKYPKLHYQQYNGSNIDTYKW